jgi:cytochrome P450
MTVRQSLPPGPPRLPLVGNLLQFQRDPLAFVSGLHRAYGDFVRVHMLNRPLVLFFRAEHAHYILVENARNFSVGQRPMLRRFLGAALLTSDGDTHRQQRRLVQPAFHRRRVEGYAEIMTRHTVEMVERWHIGDTLDIAAALHVLTLRIVVKSRFDLDLQRQGSELSALFTRVVERHRFGLLTLLPDAILDLPFLPTREAMDARHALDASVYDLMRQRRAAGIDRGDVLSMLLAVRDGDGATLGDREIRDQAMTLIAAGHETTSNALAWTFYLLSRYPATYDRLREELACVLEGRTPTAADLEKLPYLDWVINESMRCYPPAWSVDRTANEAFELGGYRFPAGTQVVVSQWVIHHLPDVWGDAMAFRPERWDPAHELQVPRGAYFPFGMGPRMCIGMPLAEMEARLLLATIVQRVTPRMVPGWPVEPAARVTMRIKQGVRVRVEGAAAEAAKAERRAESSA